MENADPQTTDPMPALWAEFLEAHTDNHLKPWDEMDKCEQSGMRMLFIRAAKNFNRL